MTRRSSGRVGGGDERRRCHGSATSPASATTSVRRAQRGGGPLERDAVAGVDDEAPAAVGERVGEGEAEASRGPGDDGGGHAGHATSAPAAFDRELVLGPVARMR